MEKITALVLAAGLGTRMKSKYIKVLHKIAGITLLEHIHRTLQKLNPENIVFVVGHQEELVREEFKNKDVAFVNQPEQLGTGDAVKQSKHLLSNYDGLILIAPGDCPLITSETLANFLEFHKKHNFEISLISAKIPTPENYGRIIRNPDNTILKIVEKNDATIEELNIKEVNSGIYLTNANYLFSELKNIKSDNKKEEYYLTDIIYNAAKNKKCGLFLIENADEMAGINTRIDLANVASVIRERINNRHMLDGVTLIDPKSTHIDVDVQIGSDTTIYPGVCILGKSIIGDNCTIMGGITIKDAQIPSNSVVETSVS